MNGEALLLVLILIGSAIGVLRRDSAHEKESQRVRYAKEREEKQKAQWQTELEQAQRRAFEEGMRYAQAQCDTATPPDDRTKSTADSRQGDDADLRENYSYVDGYDASRAVGFNEGIWEGQKRLVKIIGVYVQKGPKFDHLKFGDPTHADTWEVRGELSKHLLGLWGKGVDEGRKGEKRRARERRRKERAKELAKQKKADAKAKPDQPDPDS